MKPIIKATFERKSFVINKLFSDENFKISHINNRQWSHLFEFLQIGMKG